MIVICRFELSIGISGAVREEEFEVEVPDEATEKERDEIFNQEWLEWASNYIDGGCTPVEGK